jgi:peptidoglycan/xylan/chitin deacetylase (PgdA/CDA1 family)
MARHFVCLTFDFDVISPWLYRGATTPTQLSRGEFGLVGAERILRLLRQYDIRSTWYIPGHTIDTFPAICARVRDDGHEIAHHGYLHEPPANLASREEEQAVLARGNEAIRRLCGEYAKGYRSPSWDLSPHTVELLLENGFLYDSSMMAHDQQLYHARRADDIAAGGHVTWGETTRLVEVPVSWSLDDFPHFEFRTMTSGVLEGLKRAGDVLDNWVDDFRYLRQTEEWGVLTYTFHPQVSGRGHRMLLLERLILAVRDLGATFARVDAVVDEFVKRQ